ncbi:hypothetical protein GF386_03045 [Candidatus Pacearchaeota archaeon]|nr:hypothetical protein [Candidatus Pacearchaeota archaeon]MBD3283116.1 hypothetical protein [Candidatus Pacearchaeota archaeon]
MAEKRGAAMNLEYVIAIVLLVVLVVFVFLYMSGAFSGSSDWWSNLFGGKVNIGAVKQGCEAACIGSSEPDWCTKQRNVVFDNNKNNPNNRKWTCDELAKKGMIEGLGPCDNIMCSASASMRCLDLTPQFCGQSNCRVQWMSQDNYDRRLRDDVGPGKQYKEISIIPSSYVSDEDKAAHQGEVCVKAVSN